MQSFYFRPLLNITYGPMAQLATRSPCTGETVGSNPIRSTFISKIKTLKVNCLQSRWITTKKEKRDSALFPQRSILLAPQRQ